MKKNTIQVRFFTAKEELRGIYAKAKNENRSLTEDESKKATEIRGTLEELQAEMLIESCERASAVIRANGGSEEKAAEFRQAFNKAVIEASQNGQPIPLRASALIDKADAQPLVELTIGDIIGPLEKGMVLDKVGCKIQTGLTEDWAYPVVEAVEASVAGEAVAISDSDIDISAVKPTPKRVAISVPVTRTAMVMTNDRLYDVVVSSLRLAIQRTLNNWMFAAAEIASGAAGPFVGATTATTFAGAAPTYKEICDLVGEVDGTGIVPGPTAAFVMTNKMKAALKATPRGNGDRMVIENDMIDGVPVFVTEYAPADTVYFGYFSYCMVGQFGDSTLIVDPYTLAKKNQVQFTLNTHFDIKAARPQAFGKLTKNA
jgi:HK97 family phage major capsid protein